MDKRPTVGRLLWREHMDITTPEKLAEIRRLNDEFRTTFRGGEIVLTSSVADLPDMVKAAALQMVAAFKDFNEENDPYEEHDYGSFDHCNREFFFKIEYFNPAVAVASEDPANPDVTKRVMTVGLSMDW
jgi:Protein of unknown function (DUF3768)